MIERCVPCLQQLPRRFSTKERGRAAMAPTRGPRQRLQRARRGIHPLHQRISSLERGRSRELVMRSPAQRLMTADELQGLGFSLKPPRWLRNDTKKIGKFIAKHKTALLVGASVVTAGVLAPGAALAVGGGLLRAGGAAARFLGRGVAAGERAVAGEVHRILHPGGTKPTDQPGPGDGGDDGGDGGGGGGAPTSGPVPTSPFPGGGGGGGGAPATGGDMPGSAPADAGSDAQPEKPKLPIAAIVIGVALIGMAVTSHASHRKTARA